MTLRVALSGLLAAVLLCGGTAVVTADDEAESAMPEYSEAGADDCLGCHQEPGMAEFFRSPHAAVSDPRAPGGQHQCESCHGPLGAHLPMHGDAVISFGAGAHTSVDEQNGVCLECHQDVDTHWASSVHASEDLACVSCHTIHTQHDPVLSISEEPERCYACHKKERGQMHRPYAHPVRFGKMNCSTCHAAHGSPADAALKQVTLNETCWECHAEKRGPFAFEHAPASEDCSLCHEPHGSSHPGMLVKTPHLLCQQCHSERDHPSIRFTPAGLEEDSRSGFLLGRSCMNCHSNVHGSNHPSGSTLTR